MHVFPRRMGKHPDSKAVRTQIDDMKCLGYTKVKIFMCRGFYSKDEINSLYRKHVKIIV